LLVYAGFTSSCNLASKVVKLGMYSWSVDEEKLKRENPKEYKIWREVQLINYGLRGEKLDRKILLKNWGEIKPQIDPLKAAVIEYWLWDIIPQSLPNYKNGSWNW